MVGYLCILYVSLDEGRSFCRQVRTTNSEIGIGVGGTVPSLNALADTDAVFAN